LADECGKALTDFFAMRRAQKQSEVPPPHPSPIGRGR
jgi:hypothetical protein